MGTFTNPQEQNNGTAGADPATQAITPGASGNLLVAIASERSGLTDLADYSISDTSSNTWTEVYSHLDTNATTRRSLIVWTATANNTVSTTVTVDDATANSKRLAVMEFAYDAAITWTLLGSASIESAAGTEDVTAQTTASTASISAGDQLLVGITLVKNNGSGEGNDIDYTSSNLSGGDEADSGGLYNGISGFGCLLRAGWAQETGAGTKATTATNNATVNNTGMDTVLLVLGDVSLAGGGGVVVYSNPDIIIRR